MRSAGEMDQADAELRATICKVQSYQYLLSILQQMMGWKLLSQNICCQVWPYEGKDKVDLLVPPQEGEMGRQTPHY